MPPGSPWPQRRMSRTVRAEPAGSRPVRREVHGILLLDKPLGMSSNRALQRVKTLFRARKAGHTGSLDPLATGMLPICLGEATKVSGYLLEADKHYRVRLAFGLATTTGDAEGVTRARGIETVGPDELAAALRAFEGEGWQIPPMHSALKVAGQPLYRLARAGREVERAPRRIVIHDLVIEDPDIHQPLLRVSCSKGTYIRTLVEDIAEHLGTVAHVTELRRLSVSPFCEQPMLTLEELERAATQPAGGLDELLLPADLALGGLPAVQLAAREAAIVSHGQSVAAEGGSGMVRLYGPGGRFLGIGEIGAGGHVVPRRLWQVRSGDQDAKQAVTDP